MCLLLAPSPRATDLVEKDAHTNGRETSNQHRQPPAESRFPLIMISLYVSFQYLLLSPLSCVLSLSLSLSLARALSLSLNSLSLSISLSLQSPLYHLCMLQALASDLNRPHSPVVIPARLLSRSVRASYNQTRMRPRPTSTRPSSKHS